MIFSDRRDAGRQLAHRLEEYKERKDVIVLGLARGGVVVAHEIATALKLPLNVVVVRKIGAPLNPELALGAVTETGEGIFNEQLISILGISPEYLKHEVEKESEAAQERLHLYRGMRSAPDLHGKSVILVDDGIATGASIRVAIKGVRAEGAAKILLAIPVAAPDSLRRIQKEVDEVICLFSPAFFEAVGSFYRSFTQTSDEEVSRLLS
jgi:putative phosphoribosyl transferase